MSKISNVFVKPVTNYPQLRAYISIEKKKKKKKKKKKNLPFQSIENTI